MFTKEFLIVLGACRTTLMYSIARYVDCCTVATRCIATPRHTAVFLPLTTTKPFALHIRYRVPNSGTKLSFKHRYETNATSV
jgi:hypothetical protein